MFVMVVFGVVMWFVGFLVFKLICYLCEELLIVFGMVLLDVVLL